MVDDAVADALPLLGLELGEKCRILRIAGGDAMRLLRLSSLGLVPGAIVRLRQRRPTAVVELGETTVALDRDIAAEIWVTRQA